MKKKRIVFLTGTRADFGKIKSLILGFQKNKKFRVSIFATGMHLLKRYGLTIHEIKKSGIKNIFKFNNQKINERMNSILSNTIKGFDNFIKKEKPDLIIVHGDRLEALAGATAGMFNNILVAHIEGGELSGTVDDSLRHAISKLSHLHFVSNLSHKKRLIQLGEDKKKIFVIGSPDIDIMKSKNLPSISQVKKMYNIKFNDYSILIFHPVTTEYSKIKKQMEILIKTLKKSKKNYVVINPNNDMGSEFIFKAYSKLKNNKNFKIFESMRFEYFLTLLKKCQFIIGNSSAGIREAPFYGVSAINIGTRQNKRLTSQLIKNVDFAEKEILNLIKLVLKKKKKKKFNPFGSGKSFSKFIKIISKDSFWKTKIQKSFIDKASFDVTD
jgi:UDP-N-acetylglucosamine 2-epimerase (hydrolysing)